MPRQSSFDEFLRAVGELNDAFTTVRMGAIEEGLVFSFWSPEEIASGLALRDDWNVPSHLIPFYGDWHDLFCLDERSGAVVYLDDERSELFRWANTKAFLDDLACREEPQTDDDALGDVEVSLVASLRATLAGNRKP